jgi:hypothetical protein
MALVLKESNVQSLLTMKDGIGLAEEGFVHHARRRTTLASRMVMKLGERGGELPDPGRRRCGSGGFRSENTEGKPGEGEAESTYFAMLHFGVESDLQS